MTQHIGFLTEQDAQQKMCPLMRLQVDDYDVAGNHIGSKGVYKHCVAGSCMAWRWASQLSRRVDGPIQIEQHRNKLGFCGLAGLP